MAKQKVYEIAKEMDIQSKDIIALLQDKGIEVKSHMSVLEDNELAIIKNAKGLKSAKEVTTAQTAPVAPVAPAVSEAVDTAKKQEDAHAGSEDAHKKKKNIIFVSNPQNSKMPGGQMQKPVHQNTEKKQPVAAKPITEETKDTVVKENVVRETAPSTSEAVASKKDESVQSVKSDADVSATKVEATTTAPSTVETTATAQPSQNTSTQSTGTQGGSGYQGQRPYNRDGQNTQGGGYQGQRPYNRDGQNSQGGGYQGQRPYNRDGQNSQGGGYQGQRPYNRDGQNTQGGSGYQGQRPYNRDGQNTQGGSGYQGQRPYNRDGQNTQGGSGYQGQRPYNRDGQNTQGGSGYQGQRPYNRDGQNTQGGSGYQGQRPYNQGGQGTQGGSGYQGQRPYNRDGQNTQGGGYQGQRPYNRDGQNTQGGGYQGQRPYNRDGQNSQGGGGYQGQRPYNNNGPQRGKDDGGNGRTFGKPQDGKKMTSDAPMREAEKHRDEAQRRINQEKDKRNKKDHIYEEDTKVINKAGRFIKPEKKVETKVDEVIKVITIPETLTIKELAEKMKIQPSAIVKKLFLQGQIVTVNQEITYEKAEEIAIEYEIICEQEVKVDVIEELLREADESDDNMVTRPPVICVMGHVDHGKTSLLDAIRKTNVTDREAGGITQHIGAYMVNVNNQKITFLDTPGHEAFTSMRMRGANATDIAILVVAADDGVMPQTVEAISHAKAAGIEIIVAVNKMDKPNANMERVKQELTEYELVAEDWGGSTVFAPVSAKTGEGIQELLEMILLTSEILELKSNPDRQARGLVIEAELDKGRGPVATILVQKGTLKVGDFVSAGACYGKVRAMIDDKGRRVKEATPSTPVEILGLGDVPNAGEVLVAHENDKLAKNFAETYVAHNKEKLLDDTKAKMSLDDLFTQIKAGNLKELNLIVKADVQGSVEAVKQSLLKLSNEEVVVKIIHSGVGAINESDVILASASQAIIIGFNVRPDVMAKTTSEREGVDVRLYKVIYQAIEDVQAAMKGMLDPIFEEKIIGHAEVRQIFKASSIGNIAGSYVLDGEFKRGCKVRITRQGTLVFEGLLDSLKRFKDDVKEVKSGYECGLVFDGFDQMQEFDIVEAYIMVEVPR